MEKTTPGVSIVFFKFIIVFILNDVYISLRLKVEVILIIFTQVHHRSLNALIP